MTTPAIQTIPTSCSGLHAETNHRILVVDDNEAIHDDFRKILGSNGEEEFDAEEAAIFGRQTQNRPRTKFELGFASQGQQALGLVEAAREAGQRYAVVFVDVRMPPGWDGLETAVRLWEVDPDLQIVICTAYSDKSWEEMMEIVRHPERVLILKKPFDSIEVLQLAHALTEKWSLLQSSRRNFQDLEEAVCRRTREMQVANGNLQWEIARHEMTTADLQQSKQALVEKAALLDKAQDAIFVHDLSDQLTYWNSSAARLYGWPLAQIDGEEFHFRVGGDTSQWKDARETTLAMGEWMGELRQQTQSGRELTVESRWSLLRDEEGQPCAFLVINTDITEKKRLEAKFLRTQRMESIGTIAGGIAHDLNNLLHPISLGMDIFRTQLAASADGSMLDLVTANIERAKSLIKQVLTFARGEEGNRVVIPPGTLVDEIGNIVRASFPKAISFEAQIASDAWPFLGDATQLHQVLLNLCVNARDAMPSGGTLTVSVENTELDALQAAAEPDASPGRYVVLSVADTGTGIPENLREKIFDPFFSTKAQGSGTGLGLATTLRIVQMHGGFLSLASEAGKGTVFRIFMPVADSLASKSEDHDGGEVADVRGNGELILIVDDERSILTAMRAVLEGAGYRVLCGHDGVEGLKLYAQRPQEFGAVITDLSMPLMGGTAFVCTLKKINPAARVMVATGMASNASIGAIKSFGIKEIIPKPCSSHALLLALKRTLGKSEEGFATPGIPGSPSVSL